VVDRRDQLQSTAFEKELVAQAIGGARYIPFDPKTQAFTENPAEAVFPLNLAALSPTLIESELFGHQRGAFTGALQDRKGWFETCPPHGTVFLDEIGDVEPAIQVKLLRVLQARTFTRLGDTRPRTFQGKLIAATNRDLAAEIAAGRFREDLYYRLCADQVTTPALAEQLREAPAELGLLLRAIAQRVAGEECADALATKTETWIRRHLGPDYPWPGNVRELEQCVRNVMIRGEYRPRGAVAPPPGEAGADRGAGLEPVLLASGLTAEALVQRYVTLVQAETGSYQETARRLGLDRRTVRAKLAGRAGPRRGAAGGVDGNGRGRAGRLRASPAAIPPRPGL
jgi:DNA-binding NtrC family response regulator